jgi:hypothetical protein
MFPFYSLSLALVLATSGRQRFDLPLNVNDAIVYLSFTLGEDYAALATAFLSEVGSFARSICCLIRKLIRSNI